MGNRAYLELTGSTQPHAEDLDAAVATLEANNTLPLFWLALWDEADLHQPDWWERSTANEPRSWTNQVRTAYADPDTNGIPPLEVSWITARRRLRAAVALSQSRGDPWAEVLHQWGRALEALAARGPTVFVRLEISEIANFYPSADEYLEHILTGLRWWQQQSSASVAEIGAVTALTAYGYGLQPEGPFPDVTWHPGRAPLHPQASTRTTGGRVLDWLLVTLLSGGTLATFVLTGSFWWAGMALLLLVSGIVVLAIRN